MQLDQPVPNFSLPDLQGQVHNLYAFLERMVIVNCWSAECPWCERTDAHLLELTHRYPKQVSLLTIAANANEPEAMLHQPAHQRGLPLVLRDSDGGVCNLFGAQTTPHAFVIALGGILRYRGAVNDVTFRKRTAERWYVQEAIAALLVGRVPEMQETAPYGCAIVRESV